MRKITNSMWVRRVSSLTLAGALALPLAVQSAEATAPKTSGDQQRVTAQEQQKKQQRLDRYETRRVAALQLADSGKYEVALKALRNLVDELEEVPGDLAAAKKSLVLNDIASVSNLWSSSIMVEAQALAKAGKYPEAVEKALYAQQQTPAQEYISKFIEECQKFENAKKYNEAVKAGDNSDYANSRREISVKMREAKLFLRNRRYESAINRLEQVLLLDPFNVDAIQLLSKTYDQLYAVGQQRSRTTSGYDNARNVWEWVEPIPAAKQPPPADDPKKRNVGDNALMIRLERIIFPRIQWNELPLSQIIEILTKQSRSCDPDKIGVTIIDQMPRKDKKRRISMEMSNVSLADILRYLSMESGLSYSLGIDRVFFGSTDNMETKYFPVRGAIIAEIIDAQTTIPTSSGMKSLEEGGDNAEEEEEAKDTAVVNNSAEVTGGGEAKVSAAKIDQKKATAALKAYFEERWISFENGAEIMYSPRGERLMVRNTRENLMRMDALLRQLDALDQPMVMVEAKLIELTDTNLNELGFEWAFSAQSTKKGGWKVGTSSPLRNKDSFRVLNDLKIFPNFGAKLFGDDVKVDLSLSINAVAQNKRAEVLASPRILTVSGPPRPAMIKMINKTYFITEWEQPDVETDGFNINIEETDPEWDDEAYELGVTFSVSPTVHADNYTITLKNINPVFLTHVGDYNNPVTYTAYSTNPEGEIVNEQSRTIDMRMPEISRREMTTNITLYDGETVLIGGMVENETTVRDDKWPILGDIPLIGRLFQDKKTNVTNRTMLVFITARLINPNGTPVRGASDRGVMDFNR